MNYGKQALVKKMTPHTGRKIFRKLVSTLLKLALLALLTAVIGAGIYASRVVSSVIAEAPDLSTAALAPSGSATYIYNQSGERIQKLTLPEASGLDPGIQLPGAPDAEDPGTVPCPEAGKDHDKEPDSGKLPEHDQSRRRLLWGPGRLLPLFRQKRIGPYPVRSGGHRRNHSESYRLQPHRVPRKERRKAQTGSERHAGAELHR